MGEKWKVEGAGERGKGMEMMKGDEKGGSERAVGERTGRSVE